MVFGIPTIASPLKSLYDPAAVQQLASDSKITGINSSAQS
jgi:hypothetical protein